MIQAQLSATSASSDHLGEGLWLIVMGVAGCGKSTLARHLADALKLTAKHLAKLGVTSLDMLERPLPAGIVAEVNIALRADDAGAERNRVVSFDVVAVLADPTADDDFASPTNSTTTEVF